MMATDLHADNVYLLKQEKAGKPPQLVAGVVDSDMVIKADQPLSVADATILADRLRNLLVNAGRYDLFRDTDWTHGPAALRSIWTVRFADTEVPF